MRVICLQNGLSMDEITMTEATKLFNESKHLLQTNTSATVGTGTVELLLFFNKLMILNCLYVTKFVLCKLGSNWIKFYVVFDLYIWSSRKKQNVTGLRLFCIQREDLVRVIQITQIQRRMKKGLPCAKYWEWRS